MAAVLRQKPAAPAVTSADRSPARAPSDRARARDDGIMVCYRAVLELQYEYGSFSAQVEARKKKEGAKDKEAKPLGSQSLRRGVPSASRLGQPLERCVAPNRGHFAITSLAGRH